MSWDKGLIKRRNVEICLMFKTIEKLRLSAGMSSEESKQEAYDSIELRYGLTKTRVRHIVCAHLREDNSSYMPSIIQDNISLIKLLEEVNNDYKS